MGSVEAKIFEDAIEYMKTLEYKPCSYCQHDESGMLCNACTHNKLIIETLRNNIVVLAERRLVQYGRID